ncbi:unnamed protein product, partial [Iphiclides podalirius]
MQAVYTKDLVPNRITSSQRILSEAISNFQSSDDQITLEASTESLFLRNYIGGECIDLSKIIRTQINIKAPEFDSYTIATSKPDNPTQTTSTQHSAPEVERSKRKDSCGMILGFTYINNND